MLDNQLVFENSNLIIENFQCLFALIQTMRKRAKDTSKIIKELGKSIEIKDFEKVAL